MLSNCKYNKIKLLHELSTMLWFLEKCGIQDAKDAGDTECIKAFNELKESLTKHIDNLDASIGS